MEIPFRTEEERIAEEALLLKNIATQMEVLEGLLKRCSDHWAYEDRIYRFYHQSLKVYALQKSTEEIVAVLQGLAPHLPLHKWFREIVQQGTGKEFSLEHNNNWMLHARPIVEAFFHARFMLEMICKYGKELKEPTPVLPSGWAAVLYLYNIR